MSDQRGQSGGIKAGRHKAIKPEVKKGSESSVLKEQEPKDMALFSFCQHFSLLLGFKKAVSAAHPR